MALSLAALLLASLASASPASARQAPCGGDFGRWRAGVIEQARAEGVGPRGLALLARAGPNPEVIRLDRSQTAFTQSFRTFSDRTISNQRLAAGRARLNQYGRIFSAVERRFGVPGPVIAAFWGMETDYGANLGTFDIVDALATLAHDCRRPDLFRNELISAGRLADRGWLPENRMRGAWAGELGQVQVLPTDYIELGVDFDGDSRVDPVSSVPDAVATAASLARNFGWRRGEPWLEEVRIPPELPWEEVGLDVSWPRARWAQLGVTRADGRPLPADRLSASLYLPMGRHGAAFLAYPNFGVFMEWNKSLVYATTLAYFANRLAGAPPLRRGGPVEELSPAEVQRLQAVLRRRGHDVGPIDGIIGAGTRAAVKREQLRLGLPADSWPTRELLARLR